MIDLGPGGGVNGGEIVAVGTPEVVVVAEPKSFTGHYLKPLLERSSPALVTPAKAGAQPEKKTRRKAAPSSVDEDEMAGAK